MLYVDIPSLADLKSLAAHRDDICVSIYLPTTPVSQETAGDRIELKNLAKQALRQLETANADKRRVAALIEHLDDLVDDDEFWRFQARSLAVLATPDNAQTFRVPNALVTIVEVSDRFHLKPLLRTVAFEANAALRPRGQSSHFGCASVTSGFQPTPNMASCRKKVYLFAHGAEIFRQSALRM
jgi:hypothetical protein